MKIKKIVQSKFFWALAIIFILHILTYPSVHHIIDEYMYVTLAKHVCNFDFSDFLGKNTENYLHNTPLYSIILCSFSFIHNFNVESAEIVTYIFWISLAVGWYYSIPKFWKIDRRKLILLILGNGLLWVYSLRVLIDVPLAFFLSLGMFHLYLFFAYKKIKNYYISLLLLSLALLTKEGAILFFPVFIIYLLLKKEINIKNLCMLLLPLLPIALFTIYQYSSGFPVFDILLYNLKSTSTLAQGYEKIPYSMLPTIVFIIGIFGPGIISCIWAWKNLKKNKVIRDFLIFSLILYIIWEINYDFIAFANMPRYHTTLIPFLSLIIVDASEKNKKLNKIYYLTLIYTLAIGFFGSYYFHTQTLEIWKVSLKDILKVFIIK